MATYSYRKDISIDAGLIVGSLYPGMQAWIWELVDFLRSVLGWVVTASSTRLGVGPGAPDSATDTDQITTSTRLAYALSWVALYHPGLDLAIVIQVGYSLYDVRIKMAFGGQYKLAGGGTATRVPALAGEAVIIGSSTDVSPGFVAAMAGGTFTVQLKGDVDSGRFRLLVYPSAGGALGATGVMLALVELAEGDPGADDTMILAAVGELPTRATLTSEASGVCWARCHRGLGTVAIVRVRCQELGSIPGSSSPSPRPPYARPIAYIRVQRDAAPADLLGRCVDLYWYGPLGSVPRMGTLVSPNDTLIFGPACFGWDGVAVA